MARLPVQGQQPLHGHIVELGATSPQAQCLHQPLVAHDRGRGAMRVAHRGAGERAGGGNAEG
eukprot:5957819-Pyramimonas_sp.AAC.1